MKKLPRELVGKIEEFEAESDLSLRGYALEKDFFVFDVIKLINTLPLNENFRFVFCGGTCLAKVYGILERMSEDVDFKIVPSAIAEKLSKTALRAKLSGYVKSVIFALEDGGFGHGHIKCRSRDDNKYSTLDVEFESAFSKPESLRAHLLLELNYTILTGSTEKMSVGTLFDKLATGAYLSPIEVECVSLREALAEKLVSFPRRLAMQLAKAQPAAALNDSAGWDKALVRHLYDVHQINTKRPEALADTAEMIRMVSSVIEKDALDFFNQHPQFAAEPLKELRGALDWAATSQELQAQYAAFVADMVYALPADIPNFHLALNTFVKTLKDLLCLINHQKLIGDIKKTLDQKKEAAAESKR